MLEIGDLSPQFFEALTYAILCWPDGPNMTWYDHDRTYCMGCEL